ncbi:MAG: alpha/beta hydrolase [bacterium]|nr:alpha/beta hydrolase [bacterium]
MSTIELPGSAAGTGKKIKVDIFVPRASTVKGDLLVLPGWKFSRTRWHKETGLLTYAEKEGYRVVFPDMNTTIYESKYFPETTRKWAAMPGGMWIKKILLRRLKNTYGLFLPKKRNFLLGLSTGGRGAALVSLENPGLFTAGAALSGDYNQDKLPADRLMAAVYGPYNTCRERWTSTDNPEVRAEQGEWLMPIYIGHGKKDKVVPFSQSDSFYKTLKKKYPSLRVCFNAPEKAGHDFTYWDSELEAVFAFFADTP